MTFPDEKMIDELLERAEITAKQIRAQSINGWGNTVDDLSALIRDLRTRTGIDVADVVSKLSAGTHVVVPVNVDDKMISAASIPYHSSQIYSVDTCLRRVYRAMIRAAQENQPAMKVTND